MIKVLEDLLSIQDLDQKIRRYRQDFESAPQRKQQLRDMTRHREEAFRQAEADLNKNLSAVKQFELDVESLRDRITRYRTQQNEVKTNDEYRTLEHEIFATEKQIRGLEDQELTLMEQTETARIAVAHARQAMKDAQATAERDCEALDRRIAAEQGDMRQLETRRAEMASAMDEAWRARYERMFQRKHDAVIVTAEGGVCGGCHMQLPPQVAHEARTAITTGQLPSCTSCGRLLYNAR